MKRDCFIYCFIILSRYILFALCFWIPTLINSVTAKIYVSSNLEEQEEPKHHDSEPSSSPIDLKVTSSCRSLNVFFLA